LILLFLSLIISKTSAELLVKDSNGNYILSFNPILDTVDSGDGTPRQVCPSYMDKMVSDGVTLCVPSTYNDGCSTTIEVEDETQDKRPNGCLTLHHSECSSGMAIDFIFFTDAQKTELILESTNDDQLRALKVCVSVEDKSDCHSTIDNNNYWNNYITNPLDLGEGCPVPIGDIPCVILGVESGYFGFQSGIAKCVECAIGETCECPSDESHNIISHNQHRCKINLDKGTCKSGYYAPDDDHGDIRCKEADPCITNSEGTAHCRALGSSNYCEKFNGFYYTYAAGTSEESKRCCPDFEAYKSDNNPSTMDHIPGGCPTPVDEDLNLVVNNEGKQPCEQRGETVEQYFDKNTGETIFLCCPFMGTKKIPAGCKVNEDIGGTCRQSADSVLYPNICVSVGSSSATTNATISDTTTSQELLDANIPLETLEAAFEEKGGVVLDANTTTAQLAAVSADKLKTAYQSKPGSCS